MNGRQLVEWVIHESSTKPIDEVCKMVGKSRGECWGCPVTKCPNQVTPFEVAAIDAEVISKAIQKLKSNQIWVGNTSGREVYLQLLRSGADGIDGGDDGVARTLLALLVENRERFLLNQALESVVSGQQSVEKAAASVHYLDKNNNNPKNVRAFKEMVIARSPE